MEEILRKLVSFQTVTGHPQPAHELIEYVADFVRHRGMHVERHMSEGFESLVATSRAYDKTPTVLLASHGDVVAAPDELFTLRQVGGKYYGRGVLDMKSALAVFLKIIDELQDSIQDYSFGLAVTMDEEVGGDNGIKKLLQEGYRPKVCIIPDGGDSWQVQTASKGFSICEITAHGTSVHSSRHWEGVNALTTLLPVISRLESLFPNQGPETNTMSVNILRAGAGSLSQVPGQASLTVDMRTINQTEHWRIRQEVRQLCEELGLELRPITEGEPTSFDLQDPYIAPYVALIESATGVKVAGTKTLATSDARYFTPFNIPCISFYPAGGNHHSSKEWVSVEAVNQMANITKTYIQAIALERQRLAD